MQRAGALRRQAQPLDGVHHVGLLRHEGAAEPVRPFQIAVQHVQHRRESEQRLHALVPIVSGGGIRQRGTLQTFVRRREPRRLDDLRRVGGGGENVGQHRIWVERDGRHELLELRRRERAWRRAGQFDRDSRGLRGGWGGADQEKKQDCAGHGRRDV